MTTPDDPLFKQWADARRVLDAPMSPLPWAQPEQERSEPEAAPTPAAEPEPTPEVPAEKPAWRSGFIDRWSPRVALAATIGLTASGEFALAQLAGWVPALAWLLPLAIDVYVVQSFRRHRDVAAALTLMVVANAIYHLADHRLFGVDSQGAPTWWLIVGVASIAPLVMWRIHRITAPPRPKRERHKQRQQQHAEAPVVAPEPRQEAPATPAPPAPPVVASAPANDSANTDRQEAASGAANSRQDTAAKKPANGPRTGAKKAPAARRQNAAKKPRQKTARTRRSMDEWVELVGPIFHAEFARLRRNPTADEFATAIANAGLGSVGGSTAKNIRAEILDRTPLPELN